MMKKIVKCGLVGGFILSIWGTISWIVIVFSGQIKSFSNEFEVRDVIANNIDGSGFYILDHHLKATFTEGPFAAVAVIAQGKRPNLIGRTGSSVSDLIVKTIAASLVTWLLLHYSGSLEFKKSVKFITMIGVVVAIAATLPLCHLVWISNWLCNRIHDRSGDWMVPSRFSHCKNIR